MKLNEANWDRIARVVLGLAGLGLAFTGVSAWGWVGLIPLATGIVGWCPLYSVFKFKTTKAG